MRAVASTGHERDPGALNRALGALLLVVLILGGFVLWIGVPVAILWILGKVADSKSEHYLLALVAIPSGMVLFGVLLAWLNALYLRVSGVEIEDEDDQWLPRLRGPLDRILGVCSIIALVVILGWVLFGGQHPDGGTVW
jgi:hypothetical protein